MYSNRNNKKSINGSFALLKKGCKMFNIIFAETMNTVTMIILVTC